MEILKISVGDKLKMKKKHPCSSDIFIVLRTGSDVRIKCTGCGRDLTIPRESLDKMVKKLLPKTEDQAQV